MTKKEYLESIGYDNFFGSSYHKNYMNCYMTIHLSKDRETHLYVLARDVIKNQQDIDNVQIAFNNVKRDFEEMQKYEEE